MAYGHCLQLTMICIPHTILPSSSDPKHSPPVPSPCLKAVPQHYHQLVCCPPPLKSHLCLPNYFPKQTLKFIVLDINSTPCGLLLNSACHPRPNRCWHYQHIAPCHIIPDPDFTVFLRMTEVRLPQCRSSGLFSSSRCQGYCATSIWPQLRSAYLSLPQSEGNTDSVLDLLVCRNLAICCMDSLVPSCSQYERSGSHTRVTS